MDANEMIEYLKKWADDNKCRLELDGEVGFGRKCIGILYGDHYPSYGWTESGDFDDWQELDEARPPHDKVPDAYHKHPCLAVLTIGDDPIKQLYLWVKHLEENNVVVTIVGRSPRNILDAAMHGLAEPRLVVKDD